MSPTAQDGDLTQFLDKALDELKLSEKSTKDECSGPTQTIEKEERVHLNEDEELIQKIMEQVEQNIQMSLDSGVGGADEEDLDKSINQILEGFLQENFLGDSFHELSTKFNEWIERQKNLPSDKIEIYKKQAKIINEICVQLSAEPCPLDDLFGNLEKLESLGPIPDEVFNTL